MRQVVTSRHRHRARAGSPASVSGKSGTAEYGGGDPPETHAWFIAYRDDLAVAVLVENAPRAAGSAAPIVTRLRRCSIQRRYPFARTL